MKRKAVKAVGPAIQKISKVPMPHDSVFEDVERMMDRLERLQTLMLDKETVSLRIVTTPEKVVIKETKRNFTWLHLYDYNVDAVIVNRIYPREALEGYFNAWVRLQEEGIAELRDSFRDVPMFMLELQKSELKGIPVLMEVSDLYGTTDPCKVLTTRRIFEIESDGDIRKMYIYLPFADKSEMELGQAGGEIQISIRNEKRCFALPDTLKGLHIASAKFDEGKLSIVFNR